MENITFPPFIFSRAVSAAASILGLGELMERRMGTSKKNDTE